MGPASFATVTTIFVDDKIVDPTGTAIACGNNTKCNGTSATCWDGSAGTNQACPMKTIQAGIDKTVANGDVVIVADGIYKGTGNRVITFHPFVNTPRHINLRSANGASRCIIDCENTQRAFDFGHTAVDEDLNRTAIVGTPTTSTGIELGKGFTIKDGKNDAGGSGAFIASTSPTFRDCLFISNETIGNGGAIHAIKDAGPLFDGCVFQENLATGTTNGKGGAVYLLFSDLSGSEKTEFINCLFLSNSADTQGGAIYSSGSGNTVISRSRIDNNKSLTGGGGVHVTGFPATVKLANCEIVNNNTLVTNPADGGGLRFDGPASPSLNIIEPEVMNCTIVNNKALSGGGISVSGRTRLNVANSTIAFNTIATTTLGGEGIYFNGVDFSPGSARAKIANSILWRTTPNGAQVRVAGTGLRIEESNIRDTLDANVDASDNLAVNTNPSFVDDNGTDNTYGTVDDNFRLQSGSACKDTGDAALRRLDFADLDLDTNLTEITPLDKNHLARVAGTEIDMGAYEYTGVTCPTATISVTSPVIGIHDSRRPHPQNDCDILDREGLGDRSTPLATDRILITLSNSGIPVGGAISTTCWSLCETGTESADTAQGCTAPGSNSVHAILETGLVGQYEVQLNRPISGAHWTRVTYTHSGGGSCVAYASLPGDVNSSGTAASSDILEWIDCCFNNVCIPDYGDYSCDINRDGAWTATDNTELQALLSGTNKYLDWSGRTLATNTCSCGAFRFAGRASSLGEEVDNYYFGDWLVNYLGRANPSDAYQEQEFLTIAGDLTSWVIQNFDGDEQQYLVDQLNDPGLTFASKSGIASATDLESAIRVVSEKK